LDWNDLKYVLAVSRSNSFKNAARVMKVSHTTVGRRIQALEDALGTALFDRHTTGVQPTDYCRRLLEVAMRVEADFQSLTQTVSVPDHKPKGIVRLNTAPWIIDRILCPAVPRLRQAFPDIRLFLIGDVVEPRQEIEDIAFSLRFDVQPRRHEIEIPLCDVGYSVYASKSSARTNQWVTSDFVRFAMRTRTWLNETHPDAEVTLSTSDAGFVHTAVVAGVGRALIPDILGQDDQRLERLSGADPELIRRYRALVPRHVMTEPSFRAVFNWIKETLAEHFVVEGDTDGS